jgi:hypothetical protein
MKITFIYTIAEISNVKPPFRIVMSWTKVTPGNILKLNRKNPILHNEKRSITIRILYARTVNMFLENNQFFITSV